MVRPLEYSTPTHMQTPTHESKTFKHSMDECSVKLNGIKTLLDSIVLTTYDDDSKHIAESAQALCDELIRELQ